MLTSYFYCHKHTPINYSEHLMTHQWNHVIDESSSDTTLIFIVMMGLIVQPTDHNEMIGVIC